MEEGCGCDSCHFWSIEQSQLPCAIYMNQISGLLGVSIPLKNISWAKGPLFILNQSPKFPSESFYFLVFAELRAFCIFTTTVLIT